MTKTICTNLSLQRVFLYQLQQHSQHEYTIALFLAPESYAVNSMCINVLAEQVDILISKIQALQILYLKHCVYKTT